MRVLGFRPAALAARRRADRRRAAGRFQTDFDLTDVPRDQFLVGGEAWRRYRAGEADPAKFGLSQLPESGDWWIAGNLMRDGAALPTSSCCRGTAGARCRRRTDTDRRGPGRAVRPAGRADAAPDDNFAELRRLYEDERLRVPATVRNAARGREEPLLADGRDVAACPTV